MSELPHYWHNCIAGCRVEGGAGRIDATDPDAGARLAQHDLARLTRTDRSHG